jgi:hypothetical protein
MEQMRRLLCSGSTTEDARPTREEAEAPRAQGELDPVAEEQEPRAYTKTSPESKRSAPEILDPKLAVSGATTARPRARRTVVALLTCAAAAMVGAGVGLFGQKEGRIEATEVGPVGAAFAMEATNSARAAANGEAKPAGVEVPKSAGAPAADTGSEAARGSSGGSGAAAQREVEPQKNEGGETKTQSKGIKPAATAPKKGPVTSRKNAGDDFNFGF